MSHDFSGQEGRITLWGLNLKLKSAASIAAFLVAAGALGVFTFQ